MDAFEVILEGQKRQEQKFDAFSSDFNDFVVGTEHRLTTVEVKSGVNCKRIKTVIGALIAILIAAVTAGFKAMFS